MKWGWMGRPLWFFAGEGAGQPGAGQGAGAAAGGAAAGGGAGAGASGGGTGAGAGPDAGAGAGAGAAGADQAGGTQTGPAGTQPGTYPIQLTEAQRKALLEGRPLELDEQQYTAGVRAQMETERRKRATAERELKKIADEREAAERKSLEEQEQYKQLYEREKTAREALTAMRTTDLMRSDFLLAATKAGVVDPQAAFLLAKAMPTFEGIKVSEEGVVSGIDAAIKALIEEKPYLVPQQQSGQGSRTPIGGPSNPGGGTPPAPPKTLAEAGNELERRLGQGLG